MAEHFFLKNPHSILETLKVRPKDVLSLTLPPGGKGGVWDEILGLAPKGVVSKSGPEVGARIVGKLEIPIEKLLELPEDGYGLWLALDCLQDPQNIGSIFRTASFFGIKGIILTKDRSAAMTASIYDVASGGVEYVPFTFQTNLVKSLEIVKEKSIWVLGSSEHAKKSYQEIKKDRHWCLVIGNEEKGIRRLTQENCDELVTIPSLGSTSSLNANVAAAVLMAKLG